MKHSMDGSTFNGLRTIAIGFITYHPPAALLERITLAVEAGFKVYLFDNSPEDARFKGLLGDLPLGSIEYSCHGRNVGLGQALAKLCQQAYEDKFEAMLYFDQDTGFSGVTLDYIERFWQDCPSYRRTFSAVVFNATQNRSPIVLPKASSFPVEEVVLAINSGSLYFLDNLFTLNWHNAHYHVDGVDYEFCLRSRHAGLKIGLCTRTPGFDHESEQGNTEVRWFGHRTVTRRYSWPRVADALGSGLKLILTAIKLREFRFVLVLGRVTLGYCFYQIAAWVLPGVKDSADPTTKSMEH